MECHGDCSPPWDAQRTYHRQHPDDRWTWFCIECGVSHEDIVSPLEQAHSDHVESLIGTAQLGER